MPVSAAQRSVCWGGLSRSLVNCLMGLRRAEGEEAGRAFGGQSQEDRLGLHPQRSPYSPTPADTGVCWVT